MKKIIYLCLGLLSLNIAFAENSGSEEEALANQPVLLVLTAKNADTKGNKNASTSNAILLSANADVRVNGVVTDVTLTHVFENNSGDWVEGNYLFPLPSNGAVDKLKMKVGDKTIVGKIRKKETAKKIYKAAVKNGQKAALLEMNRDNLFTAKVGNIPPHSTIEVMVHYIQPTHYDAGEFSLSLPTTYTPRYIVKNVTASDRLPKQNFAKKTNNRLTLNIALDAGAPITKVYSPSHHTKNELNADGKTATIRPVAKRISMDRDFRLTWKLEESNAPLTLAFTEQTDDGFFTSLRFVPTLKAEKSAQPRDIVLIIDTSGSMGGDSIRQARAGALASLDYMDEGDRFNIIEFNSEFTTLFSESRPVNSDNLNKARRFIKNLISQGGTEMYAPLDKALSATNDPKYLRQIVFLTDGAVSNETQLYNLIHEKLGQSRLFTVAIGSAPNDFFMRQTARAGRGDFTNIAKVREVKANIKKLFSKIQHPALTDIEIVASDNTLEVYPNPIPDVYWGSPIVAHIKTKTPPTELTIEAKLLGKAWKTPLNKPMLVSNEAQPLADSALAKLWAREKIAVLLERKNYDKSIIEWEDYAQEVEDIGLRYQIVSEFTSFVAVEEKLSRPSNEKLVKKSVVNQIPNGTMGFPATATSSTLTAILGALMLLLASLVALPKNIIYSFLNNFLPIAFKKNIHKNININTGVQ